MLWGGLAGDGVFDARSEQAQERACGVEGERERRQRARPDAVSADGAREAGEVLQPEVPEGVEVHERHVEERDHVPAVPGPPASQRVKLVVMM